MKTFDITKPGVSLADFVKRLRVEPVTLVESGRPVALVLPVEGSDFETVSLSLNRQFLAILEQSARRQQAEGGLSAKEMRRRLGVKSASKKVQRRKSEVKRSSARVKREQ